MNAHSGFSYSTYYQFMPSILTLLTEYGIFYSLCVLGQDEHVKLIVLRDLLNNG